MNIQSDSQVQRKTVFFIGFWPDYAEQFYDIGQVRNTRVEVINLKKGKYRGNLLARLSRRLRRYQRKQLIHELIRTHPGSSFFFQGKAKLTRLLVDIPIDFHAAVICRNIVDKETLMNDIATLKAKGVAIWSFDEGNCKSYSLKHYSQFVRKFPLQHTPVPAIDLLFVGRDKGRKSIVDELQASLSAAGFTVYIKFTGGGVKLIPYQDYLSLLANSKCLLDITQEGQNGLTLRPIEAAIYGKKLITTNASIKNTALYNANNVLILTAATTTDEIAGFLNSPPEPIAAEDLYEYSPEYFVTRLLQA